MLETHWRKFIIIQQFTTIKNHQNSLHKALATVKYLEAAYEDENGQLGPWKIQQEKYPLSKNT
uniref:Uncharacterized protein n=1 Tax=Romanomermis culicivorax TaxID=13658 RepID=A0A915J6U2_ROMCU